MSLPSLQTSDRAVLPQPVEEPAFPDFPEQSGTTLPNTDQSLWPDVSLRQVGGFPTVCLDGSPWFGYSANRPHYGSHVEVFQRLSKIGIRHFHFDTTCTEDVYHPEIRFWKGEGEFDPSAQEEYFKRLAAIRPDALFTLRMGVYAPDWWLQAHPEACQVYANGRMEIELQRAGVRRVPSLASPLWRNAANHAMEKYVTWLMESGWSKRVVSIFLCNGITWEWGLLGTDGLPDYSACGLAYFRNYLRSLYGSDKALQEAWGRPVKISEAKIPTAAERLKAYGKDGLRPVPEQRHVIDHQQCISAMNAEFLLSLAATVKRVSERRPLVGTFYGYTITAREQNGFTGTFGAGGFFGGHHEMHRVLKSPDIDFIASPFHYANRSLGTGVVLEHVPLASVHRHGKAFWDENDLWAYNNAPEPGALPPVMSVGYTSVPHETVLTYRRAWASAITRGKHQWLTELTGWIGKFNENFTDAALLEEIRKMHEASDRLILQDRTPVTEVAYVLDERSVAHLSADHKGFLSHVYHGTVRWSLLGTPFDIILLEDLFEEPCPWKLIIPACVKRTDAVKHIKDWQRKTNAHVFWTGSGAWYPPEDPRVLIGAYESAGVHRYLDQGQVWANRSMVMAHVAEAGKKTIRFREPCWGVEFFTGKAFSAKDGTATWDFQEKDVALFLIES